MSDIVSLMNEHQEYEKDWWGPCVNTFSEEAKQISYAHRMRLVNEPDLYTGRWPQYDMRGKSVLDIGGGPVSILLKCVNLGKALVVDPCPYPAWVRDRYTLHNVEVVQGPGETFTTDETFDEVWIYNVLQHVEDPEAIIKTAKAHGKVLRIFEWIDTDPTLGHPHKLRDGILNSWIGFKGTTEQMNENTAYGHAYYGAFTF